MRELSLHIMDLAQNSISAKASLICISVQEYPDRAEMEIVVQDNGCGMNAHRLGRVRSPFFSTRTNRTIGLGIPLFQMACEMTGGSFSIRSAEDEGTAVHALFHTGHIDMIPLGDTGKTILLLTVCNPDIDFVYKQCCSTRAFTLDTRELRKVLGEDIALDHPDVVQWLDGYLTEQLGKLSAPDC